MGRSLPCGLVWMSNAAAGELLDGLRLAQVLSLTPQTRLKCADASFITLCRNELKIIADASFIMLLWSV